MSDEELTFQEFLAGRMKDRGVSVKKLSEATGIAPVHIENMLRGGFEALPSAPYFRGYLLRIGKVLGFDGEEWWKEIKNGAAVRNSGPSDSLPRNRFLKKSAPAWLWFAIAAFILIVIYLAVALPRVLGKPVLTIAYPSASPFVATSTTLTFRGTVRNADSLYLSSTVVATSGATSSEEIPIAPDGTWQKTVLLQNGLNTFDISARKFLGSKASVMEQVLYEPSAMPTTTMPSATSTSSGL